MTVHSFPFLFLVHASLCFPLLFDHSPYFFFFYPHVAPA